MRKLLRAGIALVGLAVLSFVLGWVFGGVSSPSFMRFAAEREFLAARLEPPDHAVVRTYFATDRNFIGSADPRNVFGAGRGELKYGVCDVSIPRDHRMGELEAPSIWRLEFRENPERHVVLLNTEVREAEQFFTEVAARVRESPRKSAFLFIHGYRVSFEDAARRTAQISYDLGFEGAPLFYSWPSQGALGSYVGDEQSIEWAQANIRGFLEDFFSRSDAQSVYLIAHSMGNRALTRAVASLMEENPDLRSRLAEIILAAPDIDAEVFRRDIAPALIAMERPITLYASSEDLALIASKEVHLYPRAGDAGRGLILMGGIETIDATGVDSSFFKHSYFAETRAILSDMFYLVRYGQRADERFGLVGVDSDDGRYWKFRY